MLKMYNIYCYVYIYEPPQQDRILMKIKIPLK